MWFEIRDRIEAVSARATLVACVTSSNRGAGLIECGMGNAKLRQALKRRCSSILQSRGRKIVEATGLREFGNRIGSGVVMFAPGPNSDEIVPRRQVAAVQAGQSQAGQIACASNKKISS